MPLTPIPSSVTVRRNHVRRLYLRQMLSMGQIARRLGVSKPTVMRDLHWWAQQPSDDPGPENLADALNRELEDAKKEAWIAYARSQEPKEVETETTWQRPTRARRGHALEGNFRSEIGDLRRPKAVCDGGNLKSEIEDLRLANAANSETGDLRCVTRVRREGCGDSKYLTVIGRLIERQSKLMGVDAASRTKAVGMAEEENGGANVVLYLPDNGRDRKEVGVRSAEGGMVPERESAIANGASVVARHSNVEREDEPPQNSTLESRATGSAVLPTCTSLKRDVTICNGAESPKDADLPTNSHISNSQPLITNHEPLNNNSSRLKPELQQAASPIPHSALRDPHSLRPQPGPQEKFLSTPADIAFYGGAAGGGKTWGMLFEALRKVDVPGFRAVVFRRTTVDITNAGGLWDQASEVYPLVSKGGVGTRHNLQWRWRKVNSAIQFAHLEHESDRHRWQGSQLAMIGFEELTHFTEGMFWYLLSRNRSTCGVTPYVRATCNPDPDSWVRRFIAWWIEPQSGLPVAERSGRLRWFARINDDIEWGDSREELQKKFGAECEPKSFTFIAASIHDNQALLQKDPGYLANLKALPRVDREQLLGGNWNVRHTAGSVFRREWFAVIDAAPASVRRIRYWDRAGTEPSSQTPDPDWTVGLLLARDAQGLFCVQDVMRLRGTPAAVEKTILNTASQDGKDVPIGIEQDPAQAGKFEADYYIRALAGYDVRTYPAIRKAMGDASAKLTRARPVSAQAQAGNIKLLRAQWNEPFLACLENFPEGAHDDDVDAISGAMAALAAVPELRVVSSPVLDVRSEAGKERRKFEFEREFWRRAELEADKIRNAEQEQKTRNANGESRN